MAAIALTIAGSDSGGGAGIQADLKAFSALGCYGASVITAITAQNTRAVTAVAAVSPAMIRAQIAAVFDDLAVGAVKIGMLGHVATVEAVADALQAALSTRPVPVVLDPVMVAKSGDALIEEDALHALRTRLLPMATLLTPNLPEAARLAGHPQPEPQALRAMGPNWVLLKGGHAEGPICLDRLCGPSEHRFEAPRQATKNTHGTGCSLSAAIAAGLAQGLPMPEAVGRAHCWLQGAIAAADALNVGSGHGPVHHFHPWWRA